MSLEHAPVAIVDVDVGRPLADVHVASRYSHAWVVVMLRGAPVGVVSLELRDGGCPAPALAAAIHRGVGAALVRRLASDVAEGLRPPSGGEVAGGDGLIGALLRLPAADDGAPAMPLSVAVCTRDRPRQLAACLRALRGLRYPSLDVMVVDNAPRSHDSRLLVEREFPEFRHVLEPTPGLDWARNRALAEARGDVVAFVDDDAAVDPGWATAVARAFALNPEVAALTGLVLPSELETDAQLLFEHNNTGFGRGFTRRWARARRGPPFGALAWHGDVGRLGTGANMAFRRSLLATIGGFDPALDVGTVTDGGGDLEMIFRVLKHRRTVVYEPRAVVRHEHRRGDDELLAQVRGWGTGMAAYLERTAHVHPEERLGGRLLRLRKLVVWFGGRLALSWFTPRFRRELVLAELYASFGGAERYHRARETAAGLALGAHADPFRTPAPAASPAATPASAGIARRTLELADPPAPLADLGGVARAGVAVASHGRPMGHVTVAVHDGVVGAQRLRDAVARKLGQELLGLSYGQALRQLGTALERAAR